MSAKAEIGWKTRAADGSRREVYARRIGGEWLFFERQRRFEQWRAQPSPPLEDWLCLLDAIERRVNRRLLPPAAAVQVRKRLRELYPEISGQPETGQD